MHEQEHCLTENSVLLKKSIVPAKYDKSVFSLGEKKLFDFFLKKFFPLKGFLLKMTYSNRHYVTGSLSEHVCAFMSYK